MARFQSVVRLAYRATAAALETLSEPKAPAASIRTSTSQVSLVFSRSPGPSAPEDKSHRTSLGVGQRRFQCRLGLAVEPDQDEAHARATRSIASARLPTRSRADAPAHRTPSWPGPRFRARNGGRARSRRAAPKTSADRRIAPTLCGSVTRSRQTTTRTSLARRDSTSVDAAPVQRLDLERRALMHRTGVQRRGKLPRVGDLGLEPTRRHARRPAGRRRSASGSAAA